MTESVPKSAPASLLALCVRLGEKLHAIPISAIEEVLPALPIEAIPQCPSFVRGVVFVRGHLVPVLDAAERLGLKGHRRVAEPHIVCLRVRNRVVGVEVDEALDLLEIDERQIMSANEVGVSDQFLTGVVEENGQIVRMLNPENIIHREEELRLEQLPR